MITCIIIFSRPLNCGFHNFSVVAVTFNLFLKNPHEVAFIIVLPHMVLDDKIL